ncbi:sensor domain-containing protein [Mycolicibacterium sp. HK-90]|uniref:sensor domain-containing protein n=1 Tax=Mycolicibacterium sp. HK-90 TaxID=3056937 RepID=UPI00265B47F4|nr:sensor domain-containing protein [Mycolicibacterium sp. HK-90]WKG04542.1 sensor domain-containing protein [Mycolicibacterium sp. HK-90]
MRRTPTWWMAIAVIALSLSGCTSTVSGTALTTAPSPEEIKLDQMMLPIEELKRIVGADNISFTSKSAGMDKNFWRVRDPKCMAALFPADDTDYLFTYWTAVRNQVAQDPDSDHRHWVQQTAVLYASEAEAQSKLDSAKEWWGKCASSTIPIREKSGDETSDRIWTIGDPVVDGDVIKQTTTRAGTDGWACQHALSVVAKMSVEAKVCGYHVQDQAATIVDKLAANAR